MNILLLVDCYLPSTKSSAKLVHDLAYEFYHQGHATTIVAPDDTLPVRINICHEENIRILRVKVGKIKKASRFVRALNEMSLSSLVWKRGKAFFLGNLFDVIVYYSPSIFWGSLVKRLKNHYGCRSYLILRDIFPQWTVDAGILNKGIIYSYFKWKEMQNYNAADIIGVQSPANLRYFEENGLDKQYHLEVLYNWTTLREDNIPLGAHRERLGLHGKVVFFYGGNIGVAQDMDNIIRLAKNLHDEPFAYFLLVGDGSEVPRLKAAISSNNLTNIAIHDAVGQREYLSMLTEFDVGLISLDRGLKTQNFPGKMLSYMYCSMPILASINSGNDLKTILEEQEAGLVCINGEDEKLAANARSLLSNAGLRRQLGNNARALLEDKFSVSKATEQILSHFSFKRD